MRVSRYNFVWPTNDPEKLMVFNSLTTSLVEIEKIYAELLNISWFDYDALPSDMRQFIDEFKLGGFVLDDDTDEWKILKFAYNSNKYDRTALALTIAPTLCCNFVCTYCYQYSEEDQKRRIGQNASMPDDVQEELLKVIREKAKAVKEIFITWYGGEPLLVNDIIYDMSQKIMAIVEENKASYSAGMITNGYLLSQKPDILEILRKSRISSYQITLDGPPDIHNSRRMLKANRGSTFNQIIEGIKILAANEMEVGIRINVDRSNMNNVPELLDILETNHLKDIPVSLGRVVAETAACKSFQSTCATMEEYAILNQHFDEALRLRDFGSGKRPYYPRYAYPCTACHMNTFVVDPDGDLYKCWTEIGDKQARIGKIANFGKPREKKEQLREIRWLAWDPFDYPECRGCKILPLCMGGNCGYSAMFTNKNKPDCAEWKYNLEYYIRARYQREKEIMVSAK